MKAKEESITEKRINKGWSKAELARRIGVAPQLISRIERDNRASAKTSAKIAKVLGGKAIDYVK